MTPYDVDGKSKEIEIKIPIVIVQIFNDGMFQWIDIWWSVEGEQKYFYEKLNFLNCQICEFLWANVWWNYEM